MKAQKRTIHLSFILLLIVSAACKDKSPLTDKTDNPDQKQHSNPVSAKNTKSKTKQKDTKIHTGIFDFFIYNDNGDYMLLEAKKGKDFYGFINDNNDDRSLLRGDVCEIKWKQDTIYIAGDGERPEMADWIISVKKIKDGNASKFRKEYKKELKYHWSEQEDYSQSYLGDLFLLAEYYIANSKNELIKLRIQNNEQIEYSIEDQTRNNKDYTVLGIGCEFEQRFTIMQWVYVSDEDQKIYEYDLPNDKLIEFK
ncbi:hypothetical protein D3C71_665090 [compost metagenome]